MCVKMSAAREWLVSAVTLSFGLRIMLMPPNPANTLDVLAFAGNRFHFFFSLSRPRTSSRNPRLPASKIRSNS